jgi:hypothetical protein
MSVYLQFYITMLSGNGYAGCRLDAVRQRPSHVLKAAYLGSTQEADMAGYSGTPLSVKLGITPGSRLKFRNAPSHYDRLLSPLPEGAVVSSRLRPPVDILHLFVRTRAELAAGLETGRRAIRQDGSLWVSWPKKASGVPTDVTEDTVRELALPLSLVDVKVCAIDETWSALKLVIRKSARR